MLNSRNLEARFGSSDALAASLADAASDYRFPTEPHDAVEQPPTARPSVALPGRMPVQVPVRVVLPSIRPITAETLAMLAPQDGEVPTSDLAKVRAELLRCSDPKVGLPWLRSGANMTILQLASGAVASLRHNGNPAARLVRRVQDELPRALPPVRLNRTQASAATAPERAGAWIAARVRSGAGIPVTTTGDVAYRRVETESGLSFISDLQNPTVRRKLENAARTSPGEAVDAVDEPSAADWSEWRQRTLAIIDWHVEHRVPFAPMADQPQRPDRDALAAEVGPDVPTLKWDWVVEKRLRGAVRVVGTATPDTGVPTAVTMGSLLEFGISRFRRMKADNATVDAGARVKKAALNWFMDAVGASLDDDARPHFGSALDPALERHAANRNQRALLRGWDEDLRLMTADRLGGLSVRQTLSSLMRERKMTPADVERETGIPAKRISAWRRGRLIVTAADHHELVLLERFFDLGAGSLTSMVRGRRRRRLRDEDRALAGIPAPARRHLGADAASCTEEELAERRRYVEDNILKQSSRFGAVMRLAAGQDRFAELPEDAPAWAEMAALRAFKCTPIQLDGERGQTRWSESSADMNLNAIERVLRFAHTPHGSGGLGQPTARLSIALLCNHRLVVSEMMARSHRLAAAALQGGVERGMILTSGDLQRAIICGTLFRPLTGYAWRHPELADLLVADDRAIPFLSGGTGRLAGLVPLGGSCEIMPSDMVRRAREDWQSFCTEVHRSYKQLMRDIANLMEPGRDPFEPIAPLIALDSPLSGLLRLVYAAEERMPDRSTSASLWRLAMRAQVAMRLGTITFLRSRNLRELTYRSDQTGELRYVDGAWHVVIPWRQFKNARSQSLFGPEGSKMDYHRVLPNLAGLYPMLAAYVDEVLPMMRSPFGDSSYLLPTRTAPHPNGHGMHRMIYDFTRMHCVWNPYTQTGMPGLKAFGIHALRDIGATTVLKDRSNPHRVREAADLLQTSPEMVLRRYAKLDVSRRLGMADDVLTAASDIATGRTPLWEL